MDKISSMTSDNIGKEIMLRILSFSSCIILIRTSYVNAAKK